MPELTITAPTVLVVEDEEVVSLFIRNELEDAGFEVEVAATVKEARAKLHERGSCFEAAVIDLRLPDELGDALVLELRRLQPELPIVVETGLAMDEMGVSSRVQRCGHFASHSMDLNWSELWRPSACVLRLCRSMRAGGRIFRHDRTSVLSSRDADDSDDRAQRAQPSARASVSSSSCAHWIRHCARALPTRLRSARI